MAQPSDKSYRDYIHLVKYNLTDEDADNMNKEERNDHLFMIDVYIKSLVYNKSTIEEAQVKADAKAVKEAKARAKAAAKAEKAQAKARAKAIAEAEKAAEASKKRKDTAVQASNKKAKVQGPITIGPNGLRKITIQS